MRGVHVTAALVALFLFIGTLGALASPIEYDLPLWPWPFIVQPTTYAPWDAFFYVWEPTSVEMYFHSYGSSVNCDGFDIGGVSHTYAPYAGQLLNDIWLDTFFSTNVREAVIRAYVDEPCYGLTAHLARSVLWDNLVYLRTDAGLRTFELGWYQQTDYNDLYGYTRTRRIRNIGCFLCCCCNELQALGVDVDPPTLNAWLYAHGGYSRGDCVDPMAVVRYARTRGVSLGFVRKIPLSEGMARGLRCQVSVKNHRHWVTIRCHYLRVENGSIHFLTNDPMSNVRHWVFLDDYSGVDTNDTRCFYRKWDSTQSRQSGGSPEIQEGMQQISSEPDGSAAEADWDGSSIFAATTSNVTLTLLKDGNVVAEDAETEELVSTSRTLTFSNAPVGDYELRIAGEPGTSYEVELNDYNSQMDATNTLYTGTIDGTGAAAVQFEHSAEATFWDVAPLDQIPSGTRATFMAGVVTAAVPGGFYVQPVSNRVPAVFIDTSTPAGYGDRILSASGTVGEHNGRPCLVADSVEVEPNTVWTPPIPVGVPAERANTTFHLLSKAFGSVTAAAADHVVLSDVLTVPCAGSSYPECTTMCVRGVEEGGVFHVSDENAIQVYEPDEGYSGLRSTLPNMPSLREAAIHPAHSLTDDRVEWALLQPDGARVQLHGVMVAGVSQSGFGVRELYAAATSRLRVAGLWNVFDCETVDVEGILTGLVDDDRTLCDARVWVYTDAVGKPLLYPLPVKDPFGHIAVG